MNPGSGPVDQSPSAVSRRQFLRSGSAGGLGIWGLSRSEAEERAARQRPRRLIYLLLSGGPSQLDTFDPKPEAPSDIRGPFRPISTSVPGLIVSETLPELARRAEKFTWIRSLTHSSAPIHETGLQLIQTGHLVQEGVVPPHLGAVLAESRSARSSVAPPFVLLPGPMSDFGFKDRTGQTAGCLGEKFAPVLLNEEAAERQPWGITGWEQESTALRQRYGASFFGKHCLLARQLIERGTEAVCVTMYPQLTGQITWDAHAHPGSAPTRLANYADTVCPAFDQALSALVDDLHERSLLASTLVVAVGEFGRTPRLNRQGGRDHWTKVWSAVMAGGGAPGGQILGKSNAHGAEPLDHPLPPADFIGLILSLLGVDPPLPVTQTPTLAAT